MQAYLRLIIEQEIDRALSSFGLREQPNEPDDTAEPDVSSPDMATSTPEPTAPTATTAPDAPTDLGTTDSVDDTSSPDSPETPPAPAEEPEPTDPIEAIVKSATDLAGKTNDVTKILKAVKAGMQEKLGNFSQAPTILQQLRASNDSTLKAVAQRLDLFLKL